MSTTIKPKQIFDILDAAKVIRQSGGDYIPCFAGDSGIGKSKTQQTWAKAQGDNFQFIDVRLAYLEGPDLVGLPNIVEVNIGGKVIKTTVYALPEFLPKEGQGLIVFEEPNRAHESTMNAIMQVFTDRKIGSYTLPEGIILSLAINPEGHYNVNSLDPALKNRVAMFDVKYDHMSFVKFMQEQNFNPTLLGFIADSGLWSYKSVEEIKADGTYISPRTIERVNSVLQNIPKSNSVFHELIAGLFGSETASDFIKFMNELKPIMWEDIVKNKEVALNKLTEMRDRRDYSGDMVSVTVTSVVQAFVEKKCDLGTVFEIIDCMDKDQAVNLLCGAVDDMGSDELDKVMKKYNDQFDKLEKRLAVKEYKKTAKQAKKRSQSKAA